MIFANKKGGKKEKCVDTGGEEIHQSIQTTRFAVFFLNIFRKLSRLFKLNERFKEFLRKLLGGGEDRHIMHWDICWLSTVPGLHQEPTGSCWHRH